MLFSQEVLRPQLLIIFRYTAIGRAIDLGVNVGRTRARWLCSARHRRREFRFSLEATTGLIGSVDSSSHTGQLTNKTRKQHPRQKEYGSVDDCAGRHFHLVVSDGRRVHYSSFLFRRSLNCSKKKKNLFFFFRARPAHFSPLVSIYYTRAQVLHPAAGNKKKKNFFFYQRVIKTRCVLCIGYQWAAKKERKNVSRQQRSGGKWSCLSLILHMAGLGRENGQVHVNSRCVYRSNGAMQQWWPIDELSEISPLCQRCCLSAPNPIRSIKRRKIFPFAAAARQIFSEKSSRQPILIGFFFLVGASVCRTGNANPKQLRNILPSSLGWKSGIEWDEAGDERRHLFLFLPSFRLPPSPDLFVSKGWGKKTTTAVASRSSSRVRVRLREFVRPWTTSSAAVISSASWNPAPSSSYPISTKRK